MKYIAIIVLFLFLFISPAYAQVSSATDLDLGEYDLLECVTVRQTCASCSFVNYSILFPNSSFAIINQTFSETSTGVWSAEFCNTTEKGRYDVVGVGDLDGNVTAYATFFNVGKQAPIGESLLYFLFIVFLTLLLGVLLYLIFTLPGTNEKNERGFTKKIVKLKYFKVLAMGVAYAVLVVILNLLNGLSVKFTSYSIFEGTLGFIFQAIISLVWPVTVILLIWILFMLIHDTNVNRITKSIGRLGSHG